MIHPLGTTNIHEKHLISWQCFKELSNRVQYCTVKTTERVQQGLCELHENGSRTHNRISIECNNFTMVTSRHTNTRLLFAVSGDLVQWGLMCGCEGGGGYRRKTKGLSKST